LSLNNEEIKGVGLSEQLLPIDHSENADLYHTLKKLPHGKNFGDKTGHFLAYLRD
jgi:hypothetical protein